MRCILNWFEQMVCRRGWQKWLRWDKNGLNMAEKLYFRERKEEVLLHIRCRQFLIFLFGVFITVFIFLVCLCRGDTETIHGGLIERDQEREVDILVEMEKDGIKDKEKVHLELPERHLEEGEKQQYRIRFEHYLKQCVLGNNVSLDEVNKKLNLPKAIEGGEVTVKWMVDERYMKEDGRLRKAKIPSKGVSVNLVAAINFRGWKEEITLSATLMPSPLTVHEQRIKTIKKKIKKSVKEQNTAKQIKLPEKLDGVLLSYQNVPEKKDFTPVYVAALAVCLLPFWWREKEKKQLAQRKKQLLLDHPGFVNQIMLLLSAGLTVRGAIERISEEYENKRRQGNSKRYLYEEIWGLCQDMRNGISEGAAIESFGKRCQVIPYIRFSAILCQSRKHGMAGIIQMLDSEARETFERRKEHVKRLGEEAGTKMLFPLLLMLVLVIGIIMIPAFLTF